MTGHVRWRFRIGSAVTTNWLAFTTLLEPGNKIRGGNIQCQVSCAVHRNRQKSFYRLTRWSHLKIETIRYNQLISAFARMFLRKYNALSSACWLEAYKRSSNRPPSNLFLTPVTRRKFFQGYRNARSAAQVMKAYSQAKFNTTRKLEGQT